MRPRKHGDTVELVLIGAAISLALGCVGYLARAAYETARDFRSDSEEFPRAVCLEWVEDEHAADGRRCAKVLSRF